MREMKAFGWLVDQLRQMPFRKTVVLFSPSCPPATRPILEGDDRQGQRAGINFYALESTACRRRLRRLPPTPDLRRVSQLSATPEIEQRIEASAEGDLPSRTTSWRMRSRRRTRSCVVDLTEQTGAYLITNSSKRC